MKDSKFLSKFKYTITSKTHHYLLVHSEINDITKLPKNVGKILQKKEVNIFSCQNNQIKKIPKSLFDVQTLTDLTFKNNKLKYLSHNVSKLHNLIYFTIRGNQIRHLPWSIGKLHRVFFCTDGYYKWYNHLSTTYTSPLSIQKLHWVTSKEHRRIQYLKINWLDFVYFI